MVNDTAPIQLGQLVTSTLFADWKRFLASKSKTDTFALSSTLSKSYHMKKLCLALGLVLATSPSVFAVYPDVTVQVGSGKSQTVGLDNTGDGLWQNSDDNGTFGAGSATLTIGTLKLDSDPEIFNSFSAVNNTNTTQTYTLTVNLPVFLVGGTYDVSSSIGATVTNGKGSAQTITLGAVSGYVLKASIGGVDLGASADLIPVGSPLVFNSVPKFRSATSDPIEKDSTYILSPAVAPVTEISVVTTFTLTAHSSAGISYDFAVNEVPEPSTYALLALGAGALFVAGRYRQRVLASTK